tara:strand:+ start:539 stop:739 length:201 start_codon:yes stop_codon:yes gene_type:complete
MALLLTLAALLGIGGILALLITFPMESMVTLLAVLWVAGAGILTYYLYRWAYRKVNMWFEWRNEDG